jgi:hypothetical protein
VEGFGWGGVVASAFGDVEVAGFADRVGGRVADGGEVGGAVAGAGGRMVLGGGRVPEMVGCLDGPVFGCRSGKVVWVVWALVRSVAV